jgi:hypothetical protein
MKIAFTICSNNYLAQAKTLGDSLILNNPDYTFIIGLVDRKDSLINYSFYEPHIILPVEEIGIRNFDNLWKKYNIIELNTSVKASFFKYIYRNYLNAKIVFYFDPDIQIFNSFEALEKELNDYSILITPHIVTPIAIDDLLPSENVFLNYGLYNLGFIGVNVRSSEVIEMLDWWEERTFKLGFINIKHGLFVDQIWINLVPIFYNDVKVLKDLGYNVAPWNLHERKNLRYDNNKFLMHDGSPLIFYHFSTYKFSSPNILSNKYERHKFENCSLAVKVLYDQYNMLLFKNNIEILSVIDCYYQKARVDYLFSSQPVKGFSFYLKRFLKEVTPPFLFIKLFRK